MGGQPVFLPTPCRFTHGGAKVGVEVRTGGTGSPPALMSVPTRGARRGPGKPGPLRPVPHRLSAPSRAFCLCLLLSVWRLRRIATVGVKCRFVQLPRNVDLLAQAEGPFALRLATSWNQPP